MAHRLIASNITVESIKPGGARRHLSDDAGLYLLLFVKGGSHGSRLGFNHPYHDEVLLPVWGLHCRPFAQKQLLGLRGLRRAGTTAAVASPGIAVGSGTVFKALYPFSDRARRLPAWRL